MKLKRKKITAGSYFLVDTRTGNEIARVDKTGSHLDNYPWDWYLMDGYEYNEKLKSNGLPVKTGGVSESLADIIDTLEHNINHNGLVKKEKP